MKSNISEIQRIVQTIEVTNQRAVLVYGKLFGGEFSSPYTQQPSNKMLFQNLQNSIYTVFYCRNTQWKQYTNPVNFNGMPGPVEIEQFMNELSVENTSPEGFDNGWMIEHTDAQGMITAKKGNYTRPVFHGEFLNSSSFHHHPAVNQQIRLFCRKEHKDISSGFYYVFGNIQAEDNPDQLVRIYFNIKVAGVRQLVRLTSELFNTYQVPFSFKCANHPFFYTRCDAAVLYFDKRYSSIAFTLLKKIYPHIRPHLSPDTPLFTKELAKGVAFAENPRKADESFGTHVSKMIAQGIMNAISKNLSKQHWLQEIKNNIEQQHQYRSIEMLYMNADSKYPYQFPEL